MTPIRFARLAFCVTLACLLLLPAYPFATRTAAAGTRPNIVLILTDDQRWDTLWAMPQVRKRLIGMGVTFPYGFTANPACCPSRASFLTGNYSHSTGVYRNDPPHGGFETFDDSATIATRLHNSGYRTGLVGKYLNGYSYEDSSYVPPGWDRWVAFGHMGYYDYSLSIDAVRRRYGSAPSDYSTDVLASHAVSFIRTASPKQPLFLYFAPNAPHRPAIPAPRHASAFPDLRQWRPPSYSEDDVSDKPSYIRRQSRISDGRDARIQEMRRNQYRTLLAVDGAVGSILNALLDTGRLSNTMVVFASDNGFLWGEHRWKLDKNVPYEESIKIPYVVRYDPLTPRPRTDPHLALNIDLAPTFAVLAGVSYKGAADGTSLLALLRSPDSSWRTDFVVEHLRERTLGAEGHSYVPTYCALRNNNGYTYVAYETGEEELYNRPKDPYQLTNRARDPAFAPTVRALRSRLQELCSPRPPGFSF